MKNSKLKKSFSAFAEKATPMATSLVVTGSMLLTQFACADAAEELLSQIINILGTLILGLAVLLAIMGLIHYATAHSEGDGPAKHKAIGQLAAAVMLIVLSIVLKGEAGSNLAKIISG